MESEKIIISDHDLETRFDEILDLCEKSNQPIFIKRNRKIDVALMPIKYTKQEHLDLIGPIPEINE